MYRIFSSTEVDGLLRASEGRPTQFPSGRGGHGITKHLLLSNKEMMKIYHREYKREGSSEFLLVTSFSNTYRAEMADAATLVLNSKQAQATLETFFYDKSNERILRAEIHYTSERTFNLRYVASTGGAVRTMPMSSFVMILEKYLSDPLKLHIQTFYGTIPMDGGRNYATILNARGTKLFSHLG